MKNHNEIQCPNCGGKIFIDAKLLLQGGSFSCTNTVCGSSVALNNASYHVAENAMNEFEKLKNNKND